MEHIKKFSPLLAIPSRARVSSLPWSLPSDDSQSTTSSVASTVSFEQAGNKEKMAINTRLFLTPESYPLMSENQLYEARESFAETIASLERRRGKGQSNKSRGMWRRLEAGISTTLILLKLAKSKERLDLEIAELNEYVVLLDEELAR